MNLLTEPLGAVTCGRRADQYVVTEGQTERGTQCRAAALAVVAYVALVARYRDEPRSAERNVFRFINDGPELSWPRVPQQLGTPWALVATAAAWLPEAAGSMRPSPC